MIPDKWKRKHLKISKEEKNNKVGKFLLSIQELDFSLSFDFNKYTKVKPSSTLNQDHKIQSKRLK